MTKADRGIMETNAERTNSPCVLFEFALTILNNEDRIKMNIEIMLTNNMLRFNSPVTLAISSTKNTAISPTLPNINDAINHFVNLSICHPPNLSSLKNTIKFKNLS